MGRKVRAGWSLTLLLVLAPGCKCSSDDAPIRGDRGPSASATGDRAVKSGYGSVVSGKPFELSNEEKRGLLVLARASVETWVRSGKMIDAPADLASRFPNLSEHRACFVTLRRGGQLRGCIGSLEPRRALIDDVRQNAVSAAVHDTRFRPVTEDELDALAYSISVLDLPRPLEGVSADGLPGYMQEHRPGVIIEYRGRRSTFLPSVWEELADPVDFLSRLCLKQGSRADCWKESDAHISTYGSIHFSEKDVH